jgi:hypothetical protein
MSTENRQDHKPSDEISIWFLSPMLIAIGIGLILYAKHLNETTEAVGHGLDPRGAMALGGCISVLMGFVGLIFGCIKMVREIKDDINSR